MFGFGKKKVEVTIVDADDGSLIAKSSLDPESVPELFDGATTMHFGDIEFDVVEAEPRDRASYSQNGKLTLKVRRAQAVLMAAEDIMYTLPTICNDIGNVVSANTKGKKFFEMHEDDWRQIELISKSLSDKIEFELNGVRQIYTEKLVPPGFFQAIFVRKEVREPLLNCIMSVSHLKAQLKASTEYDGIVYSNSTGMHPGGMVQNGFAFDGSGGVTVYGVADAECISTCGLKIRRNDDLISAADSFSSLLTEYDLVLVDWCRVTAVHTKTEVRRYFEALA